MTPEKVAYARQLLNEPDRTVASIARLLGVSRSPLYKAMPELVPTQRGAAEPPLLAGPPRVNDPHGRARRIGR